MEADLVFSFSVVITLVSMSVGFRLVCIFTSDNTVFQKNADEVVPHINLLGSVMID